MGSGSFRSLALNSETSYRTVFLEGLSGRNYNFLLMDFSFLQFTFFDVEHYRNAFYPNPFGRNGRSSVAEYEQALSTGEVSFEEYTQLLADEPIENAVPVLRFEMHRAGYVPLIHPTAHLHIGMHAENRWPVARELTPRLFTFFVVKHFYGSDWASAGYVPETAGGFSNTFDETYVNEKQNCRLLGYDMFHQHEHGQLHLT